MGYYINKALPILESVIEQEKDFDLASEMIKKTILNDGLVYIFGCGHSHILSEEMFYRAGGLANIYPILYEPLMLHQGAVSSSKYERENDYIGNFIANYNFTSSDTLIVISTSGINPVAIDVALHAKKFGVSIITITSLEYSNSQPSKHVDKLKLKDVGDVVINNFAPMGDAILNLESTQQSFAPVSTFVGTAILQEIFSKSIIDLDKEGISLPIFKSGNLPNTDEYNRELINRYGTRIPILK